MPRSFSSIFNENCNSPEFSKAVLWLLTIEHENGVLRYVKGWQNVSSLARNFEASAFVISLPEEGGDSPPTVNIGFDAGDIRIANILRGDNKSPKIFLELALANSPDVIEMGPMEFEVLKYSKAGTIFSVDIGYEPVLNTRIPADIYSPTLFPGLI